MDQYKVANRQKAIKSVVLVSLGSLKSKKFEFFFRALFLENILLIYYLVYYFKAKRFEIFSKRFFLDMFVLLVPPEIFSQYSDIDIFCRPRKNFNGSWCLWLKLLRQFLLALFYSVFGFRLYLLLFPQTYYDVSLITYAWQISLFSIQGITELIYWLPLKAIGFTGC